MANIENVKKGLENVKYPGFAKSIIDFGFVKDVQVDGTNCSIALDITSTAPEVEAQLRKEITACISALGLNVNLSFNKPKEQVQASNSVSGKNMIFITFTFSEEEYSKLAKEVRGDIIKQYGEVQGDIDNEIAAKAIRYWSEGIRHKHGKQPRRWLITERGSKIEPI